MASYLLFNELFFFFVFFGHTSKMNSRIIALIVLLVFCGFVFSETLEGEFGVTVRMQVDTENRLVVKTSREYHVLTDDGRMIPVQGRHSDLKYSFCNLKNTYL